MVRAGKNDKLRRAVGMDAWVWSALQPWARDRAELPVGPLFCVIDGPTRAGVVGQRGQGRAAAGHARRRRAATVCSASAPSCPCRGVAPRRDPAPADPAPAWALVPVHYGDVPPRDRLPRGDHLRRPLPAGTDDARQRTGSSSELRPDRSDSGSAEALPQRDGGYPRDYRSLEEQNSADEKSALVVLLTASSVGHHCLIDPANEQSGYGSSGLLQFVQLRNPRTVAGCHRVREKRHARSSGIDTAAHGAQATTLGGDTIVGPRLFQTRREALATIGLPSEAPLRRRWRIDHSDSSSSPSASVSCKLAE
jgi:hypothetical protein